MKRRIYFSLLISATAGLVALGAALPQGHTNQGRLQTIPEAWRGMWEVTVAYRDRETGALVATDVSTAAICPGEPIMPPQLNAAFLCSGEPSDSEIGVWCHHVTRSPHLGPGCSVFGSAELDSQRDGDIWSGAGSWSIEVFGNCEPSSRGQDFVVSGTRISTKAACDGEPSSLIQTFFPHPELVPILAEMNSHDEERQDTSQK